MNLKTHMKSGLGHSARVIETEDGTLVASIPLDTPAFGLIYAAILTGLAHDPAATLFDTDSDRFEVGSVAQLVG